MKPATCVMGIGRSWRSASVNVCAAPRLSASWRRLWWVCTTPFGCAVVPDVHSTSAGSDTATGIGSGWASLPRASSRMASSSPPRVRSTPSRRTRSRRASLRDRSRGTCAVRRRAARRSPRGRNATSAWRNVGVSGLATAPARRIPHASAADLPPVRQLEERRRRPVARLRLGGWPRPAARASAGRRP